MKKNQRVGNLVILGIFILCSLKSDGQAKNVNPPLTPSTPSYAYNYNGENFTSNVPMNEIKASAFRHFKKSFPYATNESWTKTDNGYAVVFGDANSISTHVYYDNGGDLLREMIYYEGKEIPDNLRKMVESTFPRYSIDMITELIEGKNTIYGIVIHSGNSMKILRVHNDFVEVFQEFQKDSD